MKKEKKLALSKKKRRQGILNTNSFSKQEREKKPANHQLEKLETKGGGVNKKKGQQQGTIM